MTEHEGATFGEELAGRELEGDVFVQCDLRGADLRETTTRGCRFDRCNLVNADLSGSVHEGSAFLNCDLRGATLSTTTWRGCKLTGSDLTDARLLAITIVEGDWSYVNLRLQQLSGVDLTGVRLTGADLSEADLTGAVLTGADLTRAVARKTTFDERRTCAARRSTASTSPTRPSWAHASTCAPRSRSRSSGARSSTRPPEPPTRRVGPMRQTRWARWQGHGPRLGVPAARRELEATWSDWTSGAGSCSSSVRCCSPPRACATATC